MQSQYVRMATGAGTVAIWMATGWIFHLSGNAYLVVGIPYVFLFQILVARRPVTELWLRAPSSRAVSFWIWPVAAGCLVFPLRSLVSGWWLDGWAVRCWMMAAIMGAVPLAWAVVNVRALTLQCLVRCFMTAGIWGVVTFSAFSALRHHGFHLHEHAWKGFGTSFVLYLPVCFLMEEVFFRGALDSFVQRPGDRHHWLSAVFVSVLWGWWHLPISGMSGINLGVLAAFYPLFHLPFGLWFSHYWRRSGNLLVPAAVHAFIDSFRNVVV